MEPKYFYITVKIFLHTQFTSTQFILYYRTYQSLKFFSGFALWKNEYKDLTSRYFF